ncbi:hypothetical protein BMT55_05060 [Listeria newyorkensis]|uniref:Competence protein ComGG n=1 Tax=Listeria newyorkensis TaxID=1497681 RepID=A0ABX4XPY3_9LIST|nr:hypothetical protein [Listeria newyorkensis]KGL40083.1 hypothetical protein EP58_13085 [Listeria newyorkensis]PNP93364.1 hypothetical protein BMT55_05060 [Listeria newyorkensis]WAO21189.1 hypothetical protein OTR81_13100 [Listeria newyorkensis]SQC55768.1 Uncharacterised protein [Listeria newyorkensis]
MRPNGFTYILCLYITLIGIITMLGATNIYVSKLQMEKQLQNHYLATTLTNLSLLNNISRIKSEQKTFTEKHNNAVLWYNWADSTEDYIRYETTTELSNGYTLKQAIFWDTKLQKFRLLLN